MGDPRKLPPSAVSQAVFRAIEQRRHEVWVPRTLRLVWLFRVGAARWDPVPAGVIAAARERAAVTPTR